MLHSLLGDVAQGDVVVKGGRGLFPPVLSPSLDSAYSDSSRPVSSPTVSTASSSSADGSMSASLSPAAAVPTAQTSASAAANSAGTIPQAELHASDETAHESNAQTHVACISKGRVYVQLGA